DGLGIAPHWSDQCRTVCLLLLVTSPSLSPSLRRAQDDTLRHLAEGYITPQRNQQLACQRDDHCLADIASGALGPFAEPLCQGAVLLEHKPTPRQLDEAAPDPGIAAPGQAFFPSLVPALVGRTGDACIAGNGAAIAEIAQSISWTSISAVSIPISITL